jgi:hypothetical protein
MDQLAPSFQLKKNCCELEKERVAQKKKRHHDDIDADPGTHTVRERERERLKERDSYAVRRRDFTAER